MSTDTVLTDEKIFDCFDRQCSEMVINFDAEELYPVGRAIEQAVLNSEQVQAWKKDAERYHEIRSRLTGASYDPRYFEDLFIAGCMGHPDIVDGEVDAATERKA